MAWKLFILIGACNVFFCSKTTPSSKCLSIWLSICLFIPFFITITSSSFLWSLRDVQIGILYKYVSIWYDCLSYIYLSVYISIYNLFIYLSVFPFIHLLNNNQHFSSDNLEMHRICLLFVYLFFFLSDYKTIYLLHRLQKYVYISNNSSIFQSLQTNPFCISI